MSTDVVTSFERAFAEHVGARFAIGLVNGTSTIHTALAALRVVGDDLVFVPPLTMASTTIAVLHAGCRPTFIDVDPRTWLMEDVALGSGEVSVPVSLYGLHADTMSHGDVVDDAAQTLRPHSGCAFTSYSFQSSKHLGTGEGGMLVTDSEELATRAREFSSLGYRMDAKSPRIDPATIKHPDYKRHHSIGFNYRMSPVVAQAGLDAMSRSANRMYGDTDLDRRRVAAGLYREAIEGCSWMKPQHVPDGWQHDYWSYAVALESKELWEPFTDAIVRHGGERPFGCWGITYQEPALRHLAEDGTCPIAEDLQPRIVQAQTNNLASARTNADAWSKAIKELNG